MKYVILANSNNNTFDIPRQLTEINGEPLVKRTIRLLKENGIKDIIITASDERFDNLGAERYEPKNSTYDYNTGAGYWLDAFPFELLTEPVCFIWGDVYFSDKAIKTIVKSKTKSTLFFCTYNNQDEKYIKHHDEPLAYKVVDTELFKEHIIKVKKMYDDRITYRNPIIWEVYRSINGIDVNEHKMTKNYIAINDESCDIDSKRDIDLIKVSVGEREMITCKVIKDFTLGEFDKIKNIKRKTINEEGKLFTGDIFECDKKMAKYLLGDNDKKAIVIEILEVIPEEEK